VPEFRRKNIRLHSDNYQGGRWYFVTACCERRQKHLADPSIAQWIIATLRATAARNCFSVHAYCLMPDHMHLLVRGTEASSNLLPFVSEFKRGTGQEFEKRTKQRLWQKKVYDRILRRLESIDAVAWYIWLNPVRKGSVRRRPNIRFRAASQWIGKRP